MCNVHAKKGGTLFGFTDMSNKQTVKNATKGKMIKGKNEKKIFYVLFQGKVRLTQFLGRALRLGQARGPSTAATSSKEHTNSLKLTKNRLFEAFPVCLTF